ncbi:hypothetical protein [uncultured Campylobacter sp.]|uniref:hypothetical protein n=1 Tax=uncultured Campylobacter sp. TaxID=218934 RepID=UPI002601F70F|nr:hypothetical protein [uncultured Campylobacter sp.]
MKQEIANHILKTCYWGNMNITPEELLKDIDDKDFARMIFSAIFQNSISLLIDLSIIKDEYVVEFIKEKETKLKSGSFNYRFLKRRLDCLINLYIDNSHDIRARNWNF